MVQRQLPKPAEIFDLLKFKAPELDGRKRRLQAALTIADLRTIAKRRTPKAAFDYTDGAAEGELSLSRARQAGTPARRQHRMVGKTGNDKNWPFGNPKYTARLAQK